MHDSTPHPHLDSQFVDIKYGLPLASVKHETDGGLKKYSVPFSFIVPSFFEYPPSTNPLLCSALPPSFDTAAPGPTPWHQVPPPRLAIAYRLHARVQYRDGGGTEPCPIEETKPIHIIANPPAQAEQLPEEFAAARRATLSKHALGGRLGSIDVCASEPPPLIQLSSTLLASTQSTLSVTVNAASMSQSRLQKISLHVRPSIRKKTFYSPNAMQCPPKEADLAGKNLVRLHENVMPLSEQRFSNLGWRLRSQGMEMCAPPTYEDSESVMQEIRLIASSGSGGLSPSDTSSVTPRVSQDGSWTASLELSIQPPALLVPAFCGRHIARSYSLVLRIRVSGAHGKIPDLELPLQVVYPPPPPPPSGQTSMLEQVSGLCQGADGLLAQEQVRICSGIALWAVVVLKHLIQTLPSY